MEHRLSSPKIRENRSRLGAAAPEASAPPRSRNQCFLQVNRGPGGPSAAPPVSPYASPRDLAKDPLAPTLVRGEPLRPMTTIVLVSKNGRACVAADTLAHYGDQQEPAKLIANHEKIVSVDEAYLAPTGPASAQLVLRSYFQDTSVERGFGSDLEIFETTLELQRAMKADYGLNPKEDESDPFESIQMELAICCPAGIFGVYPLRSVQEYTRYYAFGSGAPYALGALHALWDRYTEPEDLARAAMESAAAFDDGTALPLTIRSVPLRRAGGAVDHRIAAT